ncbi:MAG: maltokinase [Microbacteriaceae bacterium]|nr:maltokinase [Microbacteriaceae bacterium]
MPDVRSGPPQTDLDPRLTRWIAGQRWFASAADPRLVPLGSFRLSGPDDASLDTLLVLDRSPGSEALYQVPLVTRDAAGPDLPGVVLEDDGTVVVDGPRDRAYASALTQLALGGGEASGDDVRAVGRPLGWTGPVPRVTASRVLVGEQSNTSIILETVSAEGQAPVAVIVKLFRALHHGENPDVVLQSAIAGAGSARVPKTYGAVTGEWPDPARPDGRATGHLAVAQEFLTDTEDAWRVALTAARSGADFREPARDLGAATAEVHLILADALPTAEADAAAKAAVLDSMRSRAGQAAAAVPSLRERLDDIDAVISAAIDEDWPRFQRIHGDYHLGQVLRVPDRGWVLLDFEGEPLRPMAERNEPDSPLRDLAGMLRSFDYVAGTIEQEGGDAEAARAGAEAARRAFLDGYAEGVGEPLEHRARLLAAFELDKALYECVYEVRNRPGWLPIPERAVHRLLGDAA